MKKGRYWPLCVLVGVAALGAAALARGGGAWMHFFMGFFLCQFAMLKLFNPEQFVEGFCKYDVVAQRCMAYAYVYPFIELGLGLAYLSSLFPIATYSFTIGVMGVGAVGVVRALLKKLDVRCACMGTLLDVPLSTVTLTENCVMGLMACGMLWNAILH